MKSLQDLIPGKLYMVTDDYQELFFASGPDRQELIGGIVLFVGVVPNFIDDFDNDLIMFLDQNGDKRFLWDIEDCSVVEELVEHLEEASP